MVVFEVDVEVVLGCGRERPGCQFSRLQLVEVQLLGLEQFELDVQVLVLRVAALICVGQRQYVERSHVARLHLAALLRLQLIQLPNVFDADASRLSCACPLN